LSTTSLLQTFPNKIIIIEPNRLSLSGIANNSNRGPVTANVNPQNNLPTLEGYNVTEPIKATDALVSNVNTVHKRNLNLTKAEKELLRWHYRLGHVGFKKAQFLLCSGVVNKTEESRRLQTTACRLTYFQNVPPANTASNTDIPSLNLRRPQSSKTEHMLLNPTTFSLDSVSQSITSSTALAVVYSPPWQNKPRHADVHRRVYLC
jgi:hypothetical protein